MKTEAEIRAHMKDLAVRYFAGERPTFTFNKEAQHVLGRDPGAIQISDDMYSGMLAALAWVLNDLEKKK